ncbi:MAG: arsenite methyltransferase [Candidatus Bathyarchaeia archaeon]
MKNEEIKEKVKQAYSQRVERIEKTRSTASSCCPTSASQCCPPSAQMLNKLGYSAEEINSLPETVMELSAGCGNPTGFTELKAGETVLDLGSGGGIDVFVAARKAGENGRVIGVDFSEKSIAIAKKNAEKMKAKNVEFRLGDLENLPVENESVDMVISNCVINLAPDKEKVFKEAYRVMKSGGRMIISDMVTDKKLPQSIRNNPVLWSSCIGGALPEQEYLEAIEKVGFKNVKIAEKGMSIEGECQGCEGEFQGVKVYHVIVKARKP